MKLTFQQSPKNRRTYKIASEMPKRVEAVTARFPMGIASRVMRMIQEKAPDIGGEPYADDLVLEKFKIKGLDSAWGVLIPMKRQMNRSLKKTDWTRTVLYVQPRVVGDKADPAAVVLHELNPWTIDTLPYEPSTKEAHVIARRVTVSEVERTRNRIRSNLPLALERIRAAGKNPTREDPNVIRRRVHKDLAFEVLRVEFGVGDAEHHAHWRPAIRRARTDLVTSEFRWYLRWLTMPSEQRWKRRLTAKVGSMSDVRSIQAFQKYVSG